MSPALARPLLHTVHLLTFAALMLTGLLLFIPGLRAAVTGGYSQVIRDSHRWGGVVFIALPLAIVLFGGVRNVFAPPAVHTLRTRWQGLHTALTVALTGVFTITGAFIWGKRTLPESLVEVSRNTHDWLTYAAGVLVAAHLLEVGIATLAARLAAAARSET